MSVGPDQIPQEAVEAAAKGLYLATFPDAADLWAKGLYLATFPNAADLWAEYSAEKKAYFHDKARAAIAAALAAWPGMHHYIPNAEPYYGKHIILPLTQEARDE